MVNPLRKHGHHEYFPYKEIVSAEFRNRQKYCMKNKLQVQ